MSKWSRTRKYLYDPETKTICTRTFKSWVQFIVFIILFFMFIIGLFFMFLYGIAGVIEETYPDNPWFPKQMLMKHSYPGLSFVPNIAIVPKPIIWYTHTGKSSDYNMRANRYVHAISEYLQNYEKAEKEGLANPDGPYTNCSFESEKPKEKVCLFKKTRLRFCGQPDYGYHRRKPCFFLKLNKLFEWKPIGYNVSHLPEEMPSSLKRLVRAIGQKDYIWVSCRGDQPMDIEHLGKVLYYPQQGFPAYFFPYDGHPNYVSPLVAVQLEGISHGVVVTVVCQIWAKNIAHESATGNDRVYITIFIDKNVTRT